MKSLSLVSLAACASLLSPGRPDPTPRKRADALQGSNRNCANLAAIVNDYDLPVRQTGRNLGNLTPYGEVVRFAYHQCLRNADDAAPNFAVALPSPKDPKAKQFMHNIGDGDLRRQQQDLAASLSQFEVAAAVGEKADDKLRHEIERDVFRVPRDDPRGSLAGQRERRQQYAALVDEEVKARRGPVKERTSRMLAAFEARMAQARQWEAPAPLLAHAACASAALPYPSPWTTEDEQAALTAKAAAKQACLDRLASTVRASAALAVFVDASALPAAEREAFSSALAAKLPKSARVLSTSQGAAVTVSVRHDAATVSAPSTISTTVEHRYVTGTKQVRNPDYNGLVRRVEQLERCMRERGWEQGNQCRRHGCESCGGYTAGDTNRKRLDGATQELRRASPMTSEDTTASVSIPAKQTSATAKLAWRIEVRTAEGRREQASGTSQARSVAITHEARPSVQLSARRESVSDAATLTRQVSRTAVDESALASVQTLSNALSASKPGATPTAQAEQALRQALRLGQAPPKHVLKQALGVDAEGSVRDAWRAALR